MNALAHWFGSFAMLLGAMAAHAALIAVDDGKLIDNTDNGTMWVADGNLFHTLANEGGDPAGFVAAVIATSHGVINDTPNELDTPANSGTHVLTTDDLHPDNGLMTWYGAQAFVNYLNSIKYQGYDDWRLPTTADTHFASPEEVGVAPGEASPSAGELAQLFYTELGGTSGVSNYVSTLNSNAALFRNLQPNYHYGTEGLANAPDRAWVFNVGIVYAEIKVGPKSTFATLPVRSGQAPSVPSSAASKE
jgi:hypothetical protein